MQSEDIPDENRPQAVKNWCNQHQLTTPDKVPITYSLLDLATSENQEKLIEDRLQDSFVELYNRIIQVLS